MGPVYPGGNPLLAMNPFLAGLQNHPPRTSPGGYALPPTAMFPAVQQYMALQGMSHLGPSSQLNSSLLSTAQMQASYLASTALRQATTSTSSTSPAENHQKTNEKPSTTENRSQSTNSLAYSIDRLLKKDDAEQNEKSPTPTPTKPDSVDLISSTSDTLESVSQGRVFVCLKLG